MINQRTLKNSFSLEGKGLQSGLNIRITFNPAPENYGYKVKRIDIPGHPIIDALAENVYGTDCSTILSMNNIQVSTVEHALAALYACEIDNCLIEVNGSEFPILDGSSIAFVSKIKEVGIQIQNTERKYITFKRKRIKVVDKETGSSMLLLPDDTFSIQSNISFNSFFLKKQEANLNTLSEFTKDIAAARPFVFVSEIEQLLKNKDSKGGDLNNAILIYDKLMEQNKLDQLVDFMGVRRKDANKLGYIMNKPLLYPNEPARHKLLDIVGDIALVGHFIKGKIIANCPGHKINTLFARAIREAMGFDLKAKVSA
ncbi:UDP-3-O-acyl-N-acetylglucosamine deacetylase [Dysgonomonas sp. Marseille-P4677]|uniref:UDP-3-O-acyl-N-acetylglucosamine deacetylase n=1 Tax=Dysgonomonas sp. Marseille-P4677 TaxID=2364790 RepID=UPI001912BC2C|nr:UDP-3-O-acyl-N-acetylglucosamine deacetylase [Dysgonomonas sp. Marseille-P4677]MBK5723112.1 UDP-3-O-acyl-N-acetylglucosamine deacetylase [Dysgonomonas sp. Marseille-P4677]